jgi:hypothetical protein
VSHTFVSVSKDRSADQFTRSFPEPFRSLLVRAEPEAEYKAAFQLPPPVSTAGLFLRFRLGPSCAGGEDPLV